MLRYLRSRTSNKVLASDSTSKQSPFSKSQLCARQACSTWTCRCLRATTFRDISEVYDNLAASHLPFIGDGMTVIFLFPPKKNGGPIFATSLSISVKQQLVKPFGVLKSQKGHKLSFEAGRYRGIRLVRSFAVNRFVNSGSLEAFFPEMTSFLSCHKFRSGDVSRRWSC